MGPEVAEAMTTCPCHDAEHEHDYSCPCVECVTYTRDLIEDRKVDEWIARRNTVRPHR